MHIIEIRKFSCIYQIVKQVDFFQLKGFYNPFNAPWYDIHDPIPYPFIRVQLSQAPHGLITTFRALLTKLDHNVPGHFSAVHSETRHPGLCFPDFNNQDHPFWYILSRVSSPNFHLSFTRCFKVPGWIYQTLASMTPSTGHVLPWPVLPWPEIS